ncbi:MAG TPA: hypothetical protein VGG74_11440 [Kofleriaceae bacterium]|jgi:hypothetical protein
MRRAWIVLIAACQSGAPSQATGGGSAHRDVPAAPPPNVPVSTRAAAIALGSATPLAVVEIGSHGELSVAPAGDHWDNALPARAEPISDVTALVKRVLAWAVRGDKFEQYAADEWTREQRPEYIFMRDRIGEPEDETEFRTARRYFGHFPTELARDRAERPVKALQQPGRADIARAEDVDRVPPLAPLIASAPDGPAIVIARVATALGGAIAVRVDGHLGVLRRGYRFGLGSGGEDIRNDARWDEVVLTSRGPDVVAFGAHRVSSIAWTALVSLPEALSPAPTDVDILVGDGVTAQQLVDVIGAIGNREVELGVLPAGAVDGKTRLDQLLASRLAELTAARVEVTDATLDETMEPELRTVVEGARERLGVCYDARRPHMTAPDSFVGYGFDLDGSGHVSRLRVSSDDATLAACMGPILRGLAYPHMKGHVSGTLELRAPEGR